MTTEPDTLEWSLERARDLAQQCTAHGGMASVSITWHPYEAHWQASASWSDNTRVISTGSDSPVDAVLELCDLLE